MKITKKLEAEILKIYQAYWDAYLSGDMKTFALMLDDNIKVFGTAVSEVFNNKAETVRFYKARADQITGKAEFRNRKIKMNSVDKTVLIHEQCDLFVLIENEWIFYGPVRVSAIFVNTPKGWKLTHQHGSFPDNRAEAGEQIAPEKIKKENLELREAIKRRTVELENKNRELEIEASLEKVRTIAMGMRKPDDMLDVCKTISLQLQSLGVKEIRNVQTAIIYVSKSIYINYEYYAKHKKQFITEVDFKSHYYQKLFVNKMLKGTGEIFTKTIKGKKVKEWYEHQKTTNQFADSYLGKAKFLSYYWYSLGPVALGISTYFPLSEEKLNLFIRFRNVFELAYQRYLDIEKAEAQAREAKIEASLERVRAVAMSMNKSDDLLSICEVSFKEFKKLGFDNLRNSLIHILDDDEKEFFLDYDFSDSTGGNITRIFYKSHPIVENYLAQIRSAEDAFAEIVISGSELSDWKDFRLKTGQQDDQRLNNIQALYYYGYSIGVGDISISTFKPIDESQIQILKRFRNVFDLAYRRYIDIALAEAQAREAKIEASLEKVRASAMSMHKSDELLDVCEILYKELNKLGFDEMRNTIINIHNDEEATLINYDYSDEIGKSINHLTYNIHPVIEKQIQQIRGANDAFSETSFIGKDLDEWKKFRKNIGEKDDPRINEISALYYYFYSIGAGSIGISTFSSINEEKLELLKRFRNVFSLSYQRYADIALAETQAREAKIEASLERVRSKAMAMHSPNDLSDTVNVFFKELKTLGIIPIRCGVGQIDEATRTTSLTTTTSSQQGESLQVIGKVKQTGHPVLDGIFDHWKLQKEYHPVLKGKDIKAYYVVMNAQIGYPEYPEGVTQYGNSFFFKEGFVFAWTENLLSEEELVIFRRFTSVLSLTYRRYKDLKEAEAQAREAQIEAALERIRAAAMSMRDSSELSELIYKLYGELTKLDAKLDRCFIMIVNPENHGITWWLAGKEGLLAENGFYIQMNQHPSHLMYLECWEKHKKKWQYLFEGKEKRDWDSFGFSNTELARLPEFIKKDMAGVKKIHLSGSSDQFGSLVTGSLEPLPEEQQDIISRFTIAFNQAFIRFLDLQKAEAQAREAQIELALERVRARTMAMQNSNELVDTSTVLFHQLKILGIDSIRTGIATMDEVNETVEVWSSSGISENFEKKILGVVPANIHPMFTGIFNSWKKKEQYFAYELKGDELKKYYRKLSSSLSYPEQKEFNEREIIYTFFFPEGSLNVISQIALEEEECNLVIRFAKVFGLVYRRFLDLKLAEAQAREAQIELALERVRARTMAMQRSEELSETAAVLFQEFKKLGEEELLQTTIGIYNEAAGSIEFYVTSWAGGGEQENRAFNLSIEEPTLLKPAFTAWKQQKKSTVIDLKGEQLDEWLKYRNANTGVTVRSEDTHGRRVVTVAYFSKGHISISSPESKSPDTIQLLERFAGVFDGTYTRFLDLQKAEAQTRESQIQLALERVRARTMAMHKSEELSDLSLELVKQVQALGVATWFCAFNIYDDDPNSSLEWGSNGQGVFSKYRTPREGIFLRYYQAGQGGETLMINEIGEDECPAHYEYLCSLPGVGDQLLQMKEAGIPFPKYQIDHVAFFKQGYLIFITYEPVPETHDIFKRFARVFEQTYTRFLDLQKAEAQTREAQIENALEKVRSRTMAMQQSAELGDVAAELFAQMNQLVTNLWTCGFVLCEKNRIEDEWWLSMENKFTRGFFLPNVGDFTHATLYEGWLKGESFRSVKLEGKDLQEHYDWLMEVPVSRKIFEEMDTAGLERPDWQKLHAAYFSKGYLVLITREPCSEEDIFKRFAQVFDQTYTRFLDLQKAEAQAREAKIEASMEKIRSRSLAMQKPGELVEVAELLRKEMGLLGVEELETSSIYIVDEENQKAECWYAIKDIREENKRLVSDEMTLILSDTWVGNEMWKFYRSKKEQSSIVMKGDNRKEWINYCADKSQVLQGYYGDEIPERTYHLVKFNGGYMGAASPGDVSSESWDLLKRAAAVFSLAYTRFKDLQDAEASAREAQIEAALERVRSRTMGMQKSEELKDVIRVVYEQFVHLKINVDHAGFVVDYTPKGDWHFWIADQQQIPSKITHPYFDSIWAHQFDEAKEKGIDFFATYLNFEEKNKFYRDLFKFIPGVSEESLEFYFNCPGLAGSTVLLENVGLYIENFSGIPYTDEDNNTLMRFGKVFQQTYTRFLDLQKAEAQAREAKIEASLERVRSKAMAMHSPNDLSETVNVFFKELKTLGIIPIRCGVGQIDEATRTTSLTTTTASQQGESFQVIGKVKQTGHPVLDGIFDHWKLQKEYHPVLQGEDIKAYYNVMNAQIGYPEYPEEVTQYGNNFPFKEGFVFAWTENLLSEEELIIFRRFTSVLSLTYRRYLDLKAAEERNKIIRAENERKTKELEEARQLQLAMLPKSIPQIPNLDIAVYMKTATEVGGDYYDFKIQEDGVLNIGIGDATGHGLQAGTMITLMKGFFTSDVAKFNPQKFLESCNGMIRDIKLGRILMSFSHLRFENNVLLISSAGMPPIYYYHKKNNRTEEIIIQGLPLGAMRSASYKLVEKEINSGDTILLLTDGLPEQMNSHKVIFDYSRVLKYFDEIAENAPKDIINRLVQKADEWLDGQKQSDDVTFVVIKVK